MTIDTNNCECAIQTSRQKESKWRYLCSAMETVLSLGDYQKDSEGPVSPEAFCKTALGSINTIFQLEASAIYVVESDTSNLNLSASDPMEKKEFLEAEMDFLINQGTIAWAIRERRGISVFSQDGSRELLLHVISTYARIRGIFIGIFPSRAEHRPDGANEFLSLILRSIAASLEGIEYITLLNKENDNLHQEVDRKMEMLLHKERELANTRKLNAVASLAGGIAHEFNNVLTSLNGYNYLAKLDCENSRNVLQHTEKSSILLERLASLTSQLLSYSRGGRYKTEKAALETLLNECLLKQKDQADGKRRISVEMEDNKIRIQGDIKQIQQVITAVINNASEAIDVKGEIQIRCAQIAFKEIPQQYRSKLMPGEYVSLAIEDNGCGMDQQTMDRMFEPFFSTKFTGRGLSMAAVFGILENHNGTIQVDSQLGLGTTVTIYLPLV